MYSLTRRQLVSATLAVGFIYLLFSSTPRAKQSASSLSASSWSWSKPSSPNSNVLSETKPDTRITETILPPGTHASGFTIYERLYVWNGTFYVVTRDKNAHPDLKHVLSKGMDRGTTENIDPTDKVCFFVVYVLSLSERSVGNANYHSRGSGRHPRSTRHRRGRHVVHSVRHQAIHGSESTYYPRCIFFLLILQ